MNSLHVLSQELTARKWPLFIIFGLMFIGLLLIKPEENKSDFSLDWFLTLLLLFVAIFYFALTKLKIVIDNEGLELHMLFKKQRITWNSITKSKLSFEFHGHTGDVKWVFERLPDKELSFSPTFFSRDDLRKVAEALVNKSSNAVISDKVKRMSEGRFPWYIF